MDIFESIILGIIQGLTEFIPVSSSGHLELFPKFFGWNEISTSYITFIHFGTLLALLIYYRSKIVKYLRSTTTLITKKSRSIEDNNNLKIIRNIIIATIPAGILGVLLNKTIEFIYDSQENSNLATLLTSIAMITIGLIFILSDRFFKNNSLSIENLKIRKAVVIGIAQATAIFRGVSRSGATLLIGQFMGLNRVSAAEFGFLMSIPVTFLAALVGAIDLFQNPSFDFQNNAPIYLSGLISSFIFGYIAIGFMLKFLKTRGLRDFGVYRIIFGVICLVVLL